ncbi:hypothetical protein KBB76_00560 [Candidatus Saccharibacteria bacterium]|nr:hypothetical protein [Candidatus Saccharibacteria bacterium]HOR23161.1 hypothetical protein [Candidatus Saccharibacteria bacterium]HPW48351.1 hypothetical protein [Candidatus Saccharibacteria bacterium]
MEKYQSSPAETSKKWLRRAKELGAPVLALVMLAVECGSSKIAESQAERPFPGIAEHSSITLSPDDAKQLRQTIEAKKELESFLDKDISQTDKDKNGAKYSDPLGDITYGSGSRQKIANILGLDWGDQEQVTRINARDYVEETVRQRALWLIGVGDYEGATFIVRKYIDSMGKITQENVFKELTDEAEALDL